MVQLKSDNWHRLVEGNEVPYECRVEVLAAGRRCARVGAGGFVTTPDKAGLTITSDLDLRVEFALDDKAPGSTSMLMSKGKLGGTVTDMEWFFYLLIPADPNSDGTYTAGAWIEWSSSGTGAADVVSSVDIDPNGIILNLFEPKALRVTIDVNNGATGHDVHFYLADTIEQFVTGTGVTDIGFLTNSGITSIFNGTGPVLIGNINFGPGAGPEPYSTPMQGVIFKAEVRNGIAGPLIANTDFTKLNNDGVFTDDEGNVWTFAGGILDRLGAETESVIDFTRLHLEDVQIQRDMTTDIPPGVRFITGYPAAGATIILAGPIIINGVEWDIHDLLNPWDEDSPYFLTNWSTYLITIETIIYEEGVPDTTIDFTGSIDDLGVDHNTGGLTLECVDPSNDRLRNTLLMPAVASPMSVCIGGGFTVEVHPGLTGLYVIDTLLRNNGIYSSPPPRNKCIFYASLAGSAYPQIYSRYLLPPQAGTGAEGSITQWIPVEGSSDYPMTFVEGNWNKQVCRDWFIGCTFDVGAFDDKFDLAITPAANNGLTWEFWVNTDLSDFPESIQQNGGETLLTLVQTDSTGFGGTLWTLAILLISPNPATSPILDHWFLICSGTDEDAAGTTTIQFDPTPGWHQMTAQLTFNSTSQFDVDFYMDGVVVGTTLVYHLTTNVPENQPIDAVIAGSSLTCEAFQVTPEIKGTPLDSFSPGAILDASLNELVGVIDTSQQGPWQVLQDVVEAELGFAGFNELGLFQFFNRDTLRTSPVVREISSRSSLKALQTSSKRSSTANWIQVPFSPLNRSPFQAVWNVGDVLYYAAPKQAFGIFVQFEKPVVGLSTFSGVIPSGGITSTGNHVLSGFRAARKPDGSGGEVTTGINMFIEQLSPTTCWLVIENTNSFTVFFATPPGYPTAQGTPCLSLGGQFISAEEATSPDQATQSTASQSMVDSQWPPSDQGGAASNPDGIHQLQLQNDSWRQVQTSAQFLADSLLGDLYVVRPVLQNTVITMDPSLQLADRGQIVDPDKSKMNTLAQIFGITTHMSKDDATQALNLQTVGSPGAWLLGVDGHGEMGVNTRV